MKTPSLLVALLLLSPAVPAASAAPPAVARAPAGLIDPALWPTLKAPSAEVLAALTRRIPGLDAGDIRELGPAQADGLLARAAELELSGIDLFTDRSLREKPIYYLSPATLRRIFARYDLRTATLFAGTAVDGRPFRMRALIMGGGRVEVLYDRDRFEIDNPAFPGYRLLLDDRIYHAIEGAGRLSVGGIVVDLGLIKARLVELVKTGTQLSVRTDKGARSLPLVPIRLR